MYRNPRPQHRQTNLSDTIRKALKVGTNYEPIAVEALPSGSIYIPTRDAIVAQTRSDARHYRNAIETLAVQHALDVILLRQDGADDAAPILADMALASPPCSVWIEHDLALWIDDRSVWLVPTGFGPAVEVSSDGFTVVLVPPYATLAERDRGIERAAQNAARLQLVEA